MGLVAETDERALPKLLVDLLDGLLERLELFLVHFDHWVSFKRGDYRFRRKKRFLLIRIKERCAVALERPVSRVEDRCAARFARP